MNIKKLLNQLNSGEEERLREINLNMSMDDLYKVVIQTTIETAKAREKALKKQLDSLSKPDTEVVLGTADLPIALGRSSKQLKELHKIAEYIFEETKNYDSENEEVINKVAALAIIEKWPVNTRDKLLIMSMFLDMLFKHRTDKTPPTIRLVPPRFE